MLNRKKIDYSALFFISFLMTLSLAQLSRMSYGQVIFYAHDLVMVLAIATQLITKSVFKPLKITQNTSKWLWLTLLVWVGVGWMVAFVQDALTLSAVLAAIRLGAYACLVVSLTLNLRIFSAPMIRACLFFTAFLMTIWGILQYFLLPDVRFLQTFGWDDHYFRLIGPLLDPNFAGLLTILTLYYWQSIHAKINNFLEQKKVFSPTHTNILNWAVWLILLSALAMTFSRSSWLALVGSMMLLNLWSKTRAHLSFTVAFMWLMMLTGVFFVLPKTTGEGVDITRTSTITARSSLSQQLIADWQPIDWLIGKGLLNVRLPSEQSKTNNELPNTAVQPDNILLQVVGSIGLGGALMLGILFWRNRHWLIKLDPWLIGALWAVLIHAQFNNSLFQPQIWLLLLVGLARPLSTNPSLVKK